MMPHVRIVHLALALALGLAALAGCGPKKRPDGTLDAGSTGAVTAVPTAVEPKADAAHGKELVAQFQCNRCHDGLAQIEPAPQNKHCVHCHRDIMDGKFKGKPDTIARWQPRVKDLQDAPSLEAAGKRMAARWLEDYLLLPVDLRPGLVQAMPRLEISREQARDIAAYLVAGEVADTAPAPRGDAGKGRQILESKACGTCHAFSGVAFLGGTAAGALAFTIDPKELPRAIRLAPDLRHVRARMSPKRARAWLADPKAVKPDTLMPKVALTESEITDVLAYLYNATLDVPPAKGVPARLAVLSRRVTFEEVDRKVFHRTCWHCHSEPDYAIGDGGPGNSGGLGFKPRGLNLSDYNGIAAGFLDGNNERQSIFAKDKDGVPRVVRALMARHAEEAGAPTGEVRGMPLGYPALSLEDVQLVETWIAQGRPRT